MADRVLFQVVVPETFQYPLVDLTANDAPETFQSGKDVKHEDIIRPSDMLKQYFLENGINDYTEVSFNKKNIIKVHGEQHM